MSLVSTYNSLSARGWEDIGGSFYIPNQVLVGNNISNYSFFGSSMDVSSGGTYLVVGSPGFDTIRVGEVYVYLNTANTYAQQALVVSSPGAGNVAGSFGNDVAITGDGSRMIVGEQDGKVANVRVGGAYVFVRSGNTWTQEQKLMPSVTYSSGLFGCSVNINDAGDRVVVGAYGADYNVTDGGAAYIFDRSGNTWTETATLQSANAVAALQFGYGCEMDTTGNILMISTVNQPNTKVVRFAWNGASWVQGNSIVSTSPTTADGFAEQISMDSPGTKIMIASAGASNANAYIYTYSANVWSLSQGLKPSGNLYQSWWAVALSTDDKTGVVGVGPLSAPYYGVINIYKGDTAFSLSQQFSSNIANDQYSGNVAISNEGEYISVAATKTSNNTGAVYTYRLV